MIESSEVSESSGGCDVGRACKEGGRLGEDSGDDKGGLGGERAGDGGRFCKRLEWRGASLWGRADGCW